MCECQCLLLCALACVRVLIVQRSQAENGEVPVRYKGNIDTDDELVGFDKMTCRGCPFIFYRFFKIYIVISLYLA